MTMSQPFKARYAGHCAVCGGTFPEAATIRRVSNMAGELNYAHAGCKRSTLTPGGPATSKAVAAAGYHVAN